MNKHEKNLVLCGIGGCLDKLAFLPQVTSLVSKGEVKEGDVGQMIDFELGDTPKTSNMVVYFGLGEKRPLNYKLSVNEVTLTQKNREYLKECLIDQHRN